MRLYILKSWSVNGGKALFSAAAASLVAASSPAMVKLQVVRFTLDALGVGDADGNGGNFRYAAFLAVAFILLHVKRRVIPLLSHLVYTWVYMFEIQR